MLLAWSTARRAIFTPHECPNISQKISCQTAPALLKGRAILTPEPGSGLGGALASNAPPRRRQLWILSGSNFANSIACTMKCEAMGPNRSPANPRAGFGPPPHGGWNYYGPWRA